jgi:hypothetical protein
LAAKHLTDRRDIEAPGGKIKADLTKEAVVA